MKSQKELKSIGNALLDWAETQNIGVDDLAYVCAAMAGNVSGVACKDLNDLPTACITLSRVMFDTANQAAKRREEREGR